MAVNRFFPTQNLVLLLWVWGALCLPATAWAEAFATVKTLSEPDARGRWVQVDASAGAARLDGEGREALSVGMTLDLGDRIVTDQARVVLALADSEHITLTAGADITLKERSVLQSLGEVYYQVRDVFTVQYGTVQTAVEGTEFLISGGDEVTVSVTEGAVRVSNAGESVQVVRGRQVAVAPAAAPSAAVRMSMAARSAAAQSAWALGRPRLQVGVLGAGGLAGGSGQFGGRTFASIQVLPGMNLVADAGGSGATSGGSRLPGGLGLEFTVGGLSVGGSAQATLEQWRYPCGGRHIALHVGGMAHARATFFLTRRLFTTAVLRVGHGGDAMQADVAYGLGVSL